MQQKLGLHPECHKPVGSARQFANLDFKRTVAHWAQDTLETTMAMLRKVSAT